MQPGLGLFHKFGDETDAIEGDELEGTGADLADCRGQAASILLIHQDTINPNEHSGSQNASKVLWVSDLVKE